MLPHISYVIARMAASLELTFDSRVAVLARHVLVENVLIRVAHEADGTSPTETPPAKLFADRSNGAWTS